MDEDAGCCKREMIIEEKCDDLRKQAKRIEYYTRSLMNDSRFKGEQKFPNQHGEMKANIMLAVRHLEDARMRFGKVLQYADDGVSILDKQ